MLWVAALDRYCVPSLSRVHTIRARHTFEFRLIEAFGMKPKPNSIQSNEWIWIWIWIIQEWWDVKQRQWRWRWWLWATQCISYTHFMIYVFWCVMLVVFNLIVMAFTTKKWAVKLWRILCADDELIQSSVKFCRNGPWSETEEKNKLGRRMHAQTLIKIGYWHMKSVSASIEWNQYHSRFLCRMVFRR